MESITYDKNESEFAFRVLITFWVMGSVFIYFVGLALMYFDGADRLDAFAVLGVFFIPLGFGQFLVPCLAIYLWLKPDRVSHIWVALYALTYSILSIEIELWTVKKMDSLWTVGLPLMAWFLSAFPFSPFYILYKVWQDFFDSLSFTTRRSDPNFSRIGSSKKLMRIPLRKSVATKKIKVSKFAEDLLPVFVTVVGFISAVLTIISFFT